MVEHWAGDHKVPDSILSQLSHYCCDSLNKEPPYSHYSSPPSYRTENLSQLYCSNFGDLGNLLWLWLRSTILQLLNTSFCKQEH